MRRKAATSSVIFVTKENTLLVWMFLMLTLFPRAYLTPIGLNKGSFNSLFARYSYQDVGLKLLV